MYDLCKASRIYSGHPYKGPSSDGIPQRFDTLAEALNARQRLLDRNPVGWDIYNSESGERIRLTEIPDN
jgi:hypothetical protein